MAGLSGSAIALMALAYLIWFSLAHPDGPPKISLDYHISEDSSRRIEFTVFNRGNRSLTNVVIHGRLKLNGKVIDESETTLADLPRGAAQVGNLVFHRNARFFQPEISVASYTAT